VAIQSIKEHNYTSATLSADEYSYTVTYIVVTDNTDGLRVVQDDPVFKIGRQYQFGSDSNPSAKLMDVSVQRLSVDSRTNWMVECVYSTKQESPEDDEDNPFNPKNDKDDPPELRREQEFEVRFTSRSEPMYIAEWMGTGRPSIEENPNCPWKIDAEINGVSPKWTAGPYVGPVVNSAGQAVDPRPNQTYFLPVFRYTLLHVNGERAAKEAAGLNGRMNSDVVNIKNLDGEYVVRNVKPGQLLCVSASMLPSKVGDSLFWVTYEFEYDPCGHGIFIEDKGKMSYFGAEEIPTSGTSTGLRSDIMKIDGIEVFRDAIGEPVEEDVWLDGEGRKLAGTETVQRPYLIKWRPSINAWAEYKGTEPFSI